MDVECGEYGLIFRKYSEISPRTENNDRKVKEDTHGVSVAPKFFTSFFHLLALSCDQGVCDPFSPRQRLNAREERLETASI